MFNGLVLNQTQGRREIKDTDLLPSWKRANSKAVLSSTVRAVTVTGPLALLGKQPCSLTSCQSEWILQMSTESKYLWEDGAFSIRLNAKYGIHGIACFQEALLFCSTVWTGCFRLLS